MYTKTFGLALKNKNWVIVTHIPSCNNIIRFCSIDEFLNLFCIFLEFLNALQIILGHYISVNELFHWHCTHCAIKWKSFFNQRLSFIVRLSTETIHRVSKGHIGVLIWIQYGLMCIEIGNAKRYCVKKT